VISFDWAFAVSR